MYYRLFTAYDVVQYILLIPVHKRITTDGNDATGTAFRSSIMIGMFVSLFSTCWSMLTSLFTSLIKMMLFLVLFFSFCSYMGWIRRFLWFWIETQLSEIWNGAEVTIGSLEVHLVQGTITAHNAVIHTPQRKEWKWESPLIARVGKVYAEWNMWSIAYQMLYEGKDPPIVDLYSIHLSDIQVFVERQQHVFNVYLLDPTVVLPDPSEIVKEDAPGVPATGDDPDTSITVEQEDDDAEHQAQELVNQLFTAVKQIGRKGGWKGAWRAQKESLTQKLRQLQSSNKKTESMKEGVKVITKVGKAVAKTTNTYTQKNNPMTPQYRDLDNPSPTLYCRVGRVLLHHIRVFTRQDGRWNKPIILKEITIRPAELCPPMSSVDEQGHAALYQPLEKLVEVVWKRVLTEMAKSQTGRLLSTAMGEVLGIAMTSMQEAPGEARQAGITATASGATTVSATTTSAVVGAGSSQHRSTAPPTILEYRPENK
jgi:hypothetical protein